jgi:outer membrane protein assembly factor BamC
VFEPFDRAWRRVGLALDRVGFTVEDRDRQKGQYFVRYADTDANDMARKGTARRACWRDFNSGSRTNRRSRAEQYRVHIRSSRASAWSRSSTRKARRRIRRPPRRIVSLLFEQLK